MLLLPGRCSGDLNGFLESRWSQESVKHPRDYRQDAAGLARSAHLLSGPPADGRVTDICLVMSVSCCDVNKLPHQVTPAPGHSQRQELRAGFSLLNLQK